MDPITALSISAPISAAFVSLITGLVFFTRVKMSASSQGFSFLFTLWPTTGRPLLESFRESAIVDTTNSIQTTESFIGPAKELDFLFLFARSVNHMNAWTNIRSLPIKRANAPQSAPTPESYKTLERLRLSDERY